MPTVEFQRMMFGLTEWFWKEVLDGKTAKMPGLGEFKITGKIGDPEMARKIRETQPNAHNFRYVYGDPFYSLDFDPSFNNPGHKIKIDELVKYRLLNAIKNGVTFPTAPPTLKKRLWH